MNAPAFATGILAGLFWLQAALSPAPAQKTITVKNQLGINRTSETVSVTGPALTAMVKQYGADNIIIKEAASGKVLLSQAIDNNSDGTVDELIFQTTIPARATQKFFLTGDKNAANLKPQAKRTTFGRFVPERIDDYAWENDRVAFRTYGPVAQQLTEARKPGGTLTSGMDAWLKRVEYPVIDKWYKKNTDKTGSYHEDTGEGYDPYHVGDSRGIGGIGIWDNGKLYVSKNFTSHKTIATGPIRTIVELTYAPWNANGSTVTEKKRISLDLGSNLSKYEVELKSDKPLPNVVIGITEHDKKGKAAADQKTGWFRYWEPMDDSELGLGVVLDPKQVTKYEDHQVPEKDQSHVYVFVKPQPKALTYYAGFGWKKSDQFSSVQEWDAYLKNFAQRLASPLVVQVN
ncbi:DUF4861 domain-containing protein [Botryobacter ruber]|uniref:DUF4861 domain-containing protein n=1 Tax=Botryobacter ruber TaxID=2171629 RepID=UPI000E0A290A|nr:DUF4861 domain-containing protein [Botryobacter ruber]